MYSNPWEPQVQAADWLTLSLSVFSCHCISTRSELSSWDSQTEDVDAFLLFIYLFKPNEAKICFLEIAENSPAHLH